MPTLSLTKTQNILLIACLALVATIILARSSVHLFSPHYNLAAEANGLYGILNVSEGKKLYGSRGDVPYHIYVYGPLHAWVVGSFLRGIGVEGLHARVVWARLLSLFFFVGCLFLSSRYIFKRQSFSVMAIALSMGLALSKFSDYITTSRNDLFSIFIELAAISLFLHWIRKPKNTTILAFIGVAVASVLVRQMAIVAMGAACCWFVWYKRPAKGVALGALFTLIVFCAFLMLSQFTQGAFWENAIIANFRSWRSFDTSLFSPSFISFWLSYVVFAYWVVQGIRYSPKDKENVYLLFVIAVGVVTALSILLRMGGDVNYFFCAIWIGLYFAALGIQKKWFDRALPSWRATGAVCGQLLVVCLIFGAKTRSAYQQAQFPYENYAKSIKQRMTPMVLTWGRHAPTLDFHLRGMGYHGPDVTNYAQITKFTNNKLQWILKDLEKAVSSGVVTGVVLADPTCEGSEIFSSNLRMNNNVFYKATDVQRPYPDLCLFQEPGKHPPGRKAQLLNKDQLSP